MALHSLSMILAVALVAESDQTGRGTDAASATRTFSIVLNAPVARALAAFGPTQESGWSPTWAPRFLVLHGSSDDPDYAVFETGPESTPTTWVLSRYDRQVHRIQYVTIQPGRLLTVVDIHCEPANGQQTRATVTYRRIALRSDSNAAVEEFAQHFTSQAGHWQEAMNRYLERRRQ